MRQSTGERRRGGGPPAWMLAILLAPMVAGCGEDEGTPIEPVDPGCEPECPVPRPDIPPGTGMWTAATALPEGRARHATTIYRGDLVVAGGLIGPGEFTKSVIRLPAEESGWQEMADLPYQLAGLSLVVVGDTLWAVGGDGPFYSRPERALFAYDADADAWHARPLIPDWRTSTEAVDLGDRLWLTGGPVVRTEEHGPLIPGDTTLVYRLEEDEWNYWIRLPTSRLDHEVVKTDHGSIYFVGGRHGRFSDIYPDVEIYDAHGDSWRDVPDPFATDRAAATLGDTLIHVVGGDGLRRVHRALDLRTDEWMAFPGLPAHLEWPGLEFWEGALWLSGGFEFLPGNPVFHDAVWRLDPGDLGNAR